MNKIWVFGDSFSEPYEKQGDTLSEFVKWKGYATKSYYDYIAEEFNFDTKIFAKGGSSNRTILSQFISNVDSIDSNDIIIIGWSSINRFRILKNNEFFDFVPTFTEKEISPIEELSIECLYQVAINRVKNDFFYSELLEYMKLIKKLFPNNITIFWTWCGIDNPNKISDEYKESLTFFDGLNEQEKIIEETGGLIKDHHYSENGHKELSKIFLSKLKLI